MADSHSTLEIYIQKLLALQDDMEDASRLNPEDLKKVATDMGLSEQQWIDLQNVCEDHVRRGQGFLRYENVEDAVEEFNAALEINPFHRAAIDGLAQAYHSRYLITGDEEDKAKSINMSERYLSLDPEHDESLRRISVLKHSTLPGKSLSSRQQVLLIVAGTLVVILTAGVFMISAFSSSDNNGEKPPTVSVTTPVNQSGNQLSGPPVNFIPRANFPELKVEHVFSDYKPYKDAFSYKYRGLVTVPGFEVTELSLKFDLFDAKGNLISSEEKTVLDDYQPVAWNGDVIAVGWDEYQKMSPPDEIREVNISIARMLYSPAPENYEPSPEISPVWSQYRPANVNIVVRERLKRTAYHGGKDTHNEFAWEVKNTGNVSIKSLKAQIKWFDGNGQEIQANDTWLVTTSEPPLRTGDVRVSGGTYAVKNTKPENIERYELVIQEVDY